MTPATPTDPAPTPADPTPPTATPVPTTTLRRRDLRLRVATAAGALAQWASRVTGRGTGTSIRGKVIMKADPQALPKLLAHRRIAMVSGTNGKTTTTHFLYAAASQWAAQQHPSPGVVTNADGANLHHGLASALSAAPTAQIAILETDERVVADVIKLSRPEVLIMLNFSRDQLDRNHEIKRLAKMWRDALTRAGSTGPVVVANADEPLIVWACEGAHRVVWVDTESTWLADAALCPSCGSLLHRENHRWSCTGCELAQPASEWRVHGDQITTPEGIVLTAQLQVPGKFNISNAACALAAAAELGIDADTALAGARSVTSPAGRFATVQIAGVSARLLLSKNPAGWAESLPLAQTPTVVLAIDSAAADGRDVSWLWDVDYEQLQGRHVIATGPRAHDLSVRLLYAGVEHIVVPDLTAAFAGIDQPVDVIATYTPFQRLRKVAGIG